MNAKRDNRPIGVFDSGLGGLTVAAAVRAALPGEDIVYLGDTARVPYGNRSPEAVQRFARQDLAFLERFDVKAVVAACNTVSALALAELEKETRPYHLSGVILPGVSAALRTGKKRFAVLGTRGTIASRAYERALLAEAPDAQVTLIACPLFVPLVEEGVESPSILTPVFDLYLSELKRNPPDVVLLGCTHYPLLRRSLTDYFPPGVQLIDSAETAAEALKKTLETIGFADRREGTSRYFATDRTPGFETLAARFLSSSSREPVAIAAATLPVV